MALNCAPASLLGTRDATEPMLAQGAVIRPMTPAEFTDFVRQEREKWGPRRQGERRQDGVISARTGANLRAR